MVFKIKIQKLTFFLHLVYLIRYLSDGGSDQFGDVRIFGPDSDLHSHAIGQSKLGANEDLEATAEHA